MNKNSKKGIIGLVISFLIYIAIIFITKSVGNIAIGFGLGPSIGFVVGTIINAKFEEK